MATRFRYVGETKVAFENGSIYECISGEDSFGRFVSICDESGEWYRYSEHFFKTCFAPIGE